MTVADPQIGPHVAPAVLVHVVVPVVIRVVGQAAGAGVRLKHVLSNAGGYAQGPALVQSQAIGGVTVEAMHAHGFVARGWLAPDALTPQFFVHGMSVDKHAALSFRVDAHVSSPPVAPPTPVVVAPPAPVVVVEPPAPVVVVEPPAPVVAEPPAPLAEPPLPLVVVEPPVPPPVV